LISEFVCDDFLYFFSIFNSLCSLAVSFLECSADPVAAAVAVVVVAL